MYSWLRDGLIPGASALLESLWMYAWFSFFLASGDTTAAMRYPYAWLLALILGPTLIGRFLDRTMWGPQWLRQYGLSGVVIGLFVVFMWRYHAVGVAWLAACVLLGRGIWLALGELNSQVAAGWFLGGFGAFLALLGLLIVARVPAFEADRQQLGPLIALYLLLGLGWLALIRQQEMEEHAFRRASNGMDGTWLGLLGGISAAIVGLVGLVSFGAGDILLSMLRVIGAVAGFIWNTAIYVAANWLGPALLWLFGLLRFDSGQGFLERLLSRQRPIRNVYAQLLAWLQAHLPLPVLVALVLAMIGTLVAIWLAMRYRGWRNPAEDEEHSSVWSWRLFLSQLQQLLRAFRRPLGRASGDQQSPEGEAARPASSIRQLYAAALRWCRDRERPRQPATTPLEFEPVLDDEIGSEIGGQLTAAYLTTRYGERELPPETVGELQTRWEERLRGEP